MKIFVTALIVSVLVATLLCSALFVEATPSSHFHLAAHVFKTSTGEYSFASTSSSVLGDIPQMANFSNSHARAFVNYTINQTGWYGIEIFPDRSLLYSDPREAYYSMGLIEGRYTAQAISDMFFNHASIWATFTPSFLAWFDNNIIFMQKLAKDDRWKTVQGTAVYRFLAQMEGITDGFNMAVDAGEVAGAIVQNNGVVTLKKLNYRDTFLMNAAAEFGDVTTAVSASSTISEKEKQDLAKFRELYEGLYRPGSHCSALIKLTPDDLFLSHDTWNSFQGMLRMFKIFHWETTVAFSAAPSRINSGDDYYLTGNKLGMVETTLIQDNNTLIQEYVTPQSMLYFLRIMLVNVWTNNTVDYMNEFLVYNSGTYGNDNFVVDWKLITPEVLASGLLPPNTIKLCEQLPGPWSVTMDISWLVSMNKYFASYNIGYTKQVYDMTLTLAHCLNGSIFCNSTYARPLIFARDQHKVTDLASMQYMMRYNGYLISDELQKVPNCVGCDPVYNPSLAIACRSDQVPQNASWGNFPPAHAGAMSYQLFGAIDTKVASWKMFNDNMTSSIISGPSTSNGLPVFDWSQQSPSVTSQIRGMPVKYDFPFHDVKVPSSFAMTWAEYHQKYPNGPKTEDATNEHTARLIAALVGGAFGVMLIVVIVIFRRGKQLRSGDHSSRGNSSKSVQEGNYKQVV